MHACDYYTFFKKSLVHHHHPISTSFLVPCVCWWIGWMGGGAQDDFSQTVQFLSAQHQEELTLNSYPWLSFLWIIECGCGVVYPVSSTDFPQVALWILHLLQASHTCNNDTWSASKRRLSGYLKGWYTHLYAFVWRNCQNLHAIPDEHELPGKLCWNC